MKNQGKSSLFDDALSGAVKDFAKEMNGKNGNQNDTDTKSNSGEIQTGLSGFPNQTASGNDFEVQVNQSAVGTRRAKLLFLLFTILVY